MEVPIESVVVVGLVFGFFAVFALTLAWASWYARSAIAESASTPAE